MRKDPEPREHYSTATLNSSGTENSSPLECKCRIHSGSGLLSGLTLRPSFFFFFWLGEGEGVEKKEKEEEAFSFN